MGQLQKHNENNSVLERLQQHNNDNSVLGQLQQHNRDEIEKRILGEDSILPKPDPNTGIVGLTHTLIDVKGDIARTNEITVKTSTSMNTNNALDEIKRNELLRSMNRSETEQQRINRIVETDRRKTIEEIDRKREEERRIENDRRFIEMEREKKRFEEERRRVEADRRFLASHVPSKAPILVNKHFTQLKPEQPKPSIVDVVNAAKRKEEVLDSIAKRFEQSSFEIDLLRTLMLFEIQ